MNKRNLSYCLRTACRLFTLGRKEREEKRKRRIAGNGNVGVGISF